MKKILLAGGVVIVLVLLLGFGTAAYLLRSLNTPEFKKTLLERAKATVGADVQVKEMDIAILSGLTLKGQPGKDRDVHLLHLHVGSHRGLRPLEQRLLELGSVERSEKVGGGAEPQQEHEDDHHPTGQQDLLHYRPPTLSVIDPS